MREVLGDWNRAMAKDVRGLYELMAGVVARNGKVFS
jgi:hypothetical protein